MDSILRKLLDTLRNVVHQHNFKVLLLLSKEKNIKILIVDSINRNLVDFMIVILH